MDPATIINVVALLVQFLDLIRDACTGKRRKRGQAELRLFHSQLHENLQFANDIKDQAVAVGFESKSLEILQNELQGFFSSAENLLSSDNCKREDIQQLRERAMGTLQYRMARIAIEMAIKSSEDVKAIQEMMAKKQEEQEMVSRNHGVQINIFQGQAHDNPMLTEILWECISRVLADEHLNLVVPTEGLFRVAGAGMIKGVEEMNEGAIKYVPKEEEEEKNNKVFLMKEGGNPMPTGPLSRMTETSWECISRVLADEHLNLVVPTKASKYKAGTQAGLFRVADAGMIEGVEEMKEGAIKYVAKEEEEEEKNSKGFLMREGAGKDLLEEKERRKEALVKDMERPSAAKDVAKEEEEKKQYKKKKESGMDVLEEERLGQRTTKLNDKEEQDNPNCNMQLTIETDTGELLVSEYKGSRWEVTYKWCKESMGMVIGNSPMEVSKKDGYCYFEVKLVDMAELHEGRETHLAGVGMGLARLDKFRMDKMAGKYSMSCGYDGRVGLVYREGRVQEPPLGFLAMGDTIGIGLLQHHDQRCIFFTKNGDLQMCIQHHSLRSISSRGGVYPVISLASAHVQLHVNFHGPFQLSEVVAQVKATLPHK